MKKKKSGCISKLCEIFKSKTSAAKEEKITFAALSALVLIMSSL